MTCDDVNTFLAGYVDDELDLATALRVEAHVASCDGCRRREQAMREVKHAASQAAVYRTAPPSLRGDMLRAIRAEANVGREWWRKTWVISGIAAALIFALLTVVVLMRGAPSDPLLAELVGAHLRSLEAEHLVDVASTDHHTVTPWFSGRIDFSPPVIDLSAEGFPLVGGRMDYLDGHKVAALVYRHEKHVINVIAWPGEASPATHELDGFHLVRFRCKGMICWAISDMNPAELGRFAELFAAQKAASTRF